MLKKANIKNICPLTPMQEGMLFHALLESTATSYVEQFSFTVRGSLNTDAFIRAWNLLVERHDILRCVFRHENCPQPLCFILKKRPFEIPVTDLSGLSCEARADELNDILRADRETGFDLAKGPLMRVSIYRLTKDSWKVIWSLHHIILDGWCLGILQEELLIAYRAFLQEQEPDLSPSRPFSEYVKWLSKRDKQDATTYWKAALEGFSMLTGLPHKLDPNTAHYDRQELLFRLNKQETRALNDTVKASGVSLNTAVRAVWSLLLAFYNNTDDVCYAATVSGRPPELAGIDRMVGIFINALPVRTRIDRCSGFDHLLSTLHAQAAEMEQYQYESLADVQALSPLKHKLLDHVLVFENYPEMEGSIADTGFSIEDFLVYEHTHYPFELQVIPEEEGLFFRVRYNSNVHASEVINRLPEHLKSIVRHVCNNPQQPISKLSFLTEEEQATHTLTNERKLMMLDAGEMIAPARPTSVIAASFTAEPVLPAVQHAVSTFALDTDITTAPYDQVFQQLIDQESMLNRAEVARFVLVRFEDWLRNSGTVTAEEQAALLEQRFCEITSLLGQTHAGTPIFVGIFPLQKNIHIETADFLATLTNRWRTFIEETPGIFPLDFGDIATRYAVNTLFDATTDQVGHIPFSEEANAVIGVGIARSLVALLRPHFKVIALDCDNTLWKGVVGEDGVDGISVGGSFAVLQQKMVDLHDKGFLLTLLSKNNEAEVREVFDKRKDMILSWEHIVDHRINWLPKADNLKAMVNDLNLGIDSVIFVDDSPAECSAMMAACPEVLTLRLPEDSAAIPRFLEHVWAFDKHQVTSEDASRSALYKAEKKREAFVQVMATDISTFIASLDIQVRMMPPNEKLLPRTAQLTQRTNQFNLSTRRYTEADIRAFIVNDDHLCTIIDVQDRFGTYGITGALFAVIIGDTLTIDTLLLSCRVLGRRVEYALLAALGEICRKRGVNCIEARYIPSAKNKPILSFMQNAFEIVLEEPNGSIIFTRDVNSIPEHEPHISLDILDATPEFSRQETSLPKTHSATTEKEITVSACPDWQVFITDEAELRHRSWLTPLLESTGKTILEAMSQGARKISQGAILPATPVEEQLAGIWQELLGYDRIGVEDDFFALGGHSLIATRLVSRVSKAFGVSTSLEDVFDYPTIRLLAAHIDSGSVQPDNTITPAPEMADYPVSNAQRRMWVLDKLKEGNIAYSQTGMYRISGMLDIDAFCAAFQSVIRRHESLRTVLKEVGGTPRQVILEDIDFLVDIQDMRPATQPEAAAFSHARNLCTAPFDLFAGPLLRISLMQVDKHDYIYLLVMHHIITDGWSFEVLGQELIEAYRAIKAGREPQFSPLNIQYKDYACWQTEWLNSEEAETHLDYWKKTLSAPIPVMAFHPDKQRPPIQTFTGATLQVSLVPGALKRLKVFSTQHRATLFHSILTVMNIVFFRYTGQTDQIFGAPVARRNRPELEKQVGFYAGTLALRTLFSPEITIGELIHRVKAVATEAQRHSDYPFDRLVEELNLNRDVSRSPLFDVMVVMQEQGSPSDPPPGLTFKNLPFDNGFSQFDMTFIFSETEECLSLAINYNTDIYLRQTVENLASCILTALHAIPDGTSVSLRDFSVLPESMKQLFVNQFNPETAPLPLPGTIHEHLFQTADQRGSDIALVWQDISLSYAELSRKSKEFAAFLQNRQSLLPGEPVAVITGRRPDMVIAMLGIMAAGGVYLPIDPGWPQKRIDDVLTAAGVRLLVVANKLPEIMGVSQIIVVDTDDFGEPLIQTASRTSKDIAYIIFTSGSTGTPKGVQVTHGGFVAMSYEQIRTFDVNSKDGVILFASPAFDASLSEVFMALLAGARLVIPEDAEREDLALLEELIRTRKITIATFPPGLLASLPESVTSPLETIITAGETLPPRIALHYAKSVNLFNGYGPTETSVCASIYKVEGNGDYPLNVPIGSPIKGTRIYILDESHNMVPAGAVGELYIAGNGLAVGYLNDENKTLASFLPCPYEDGLMYKTGDLGRYRYDGQIEFMGRADHQVKIRGYRIEPGEIEHALVSLDGVTQACVITHEEGGDKCLVAFVEGRSGDISSLRAELAMLLPGYMIPARFISVEHFERTSAGKINRSALSIPSELETLTTFEPPANSTEAAILTLWQETLSAPKMGVTDNFFHNGGDSIKAIRVISKLREQGIHLNMSDLFQHTTIRALAPLTSSDNGATVAHCHKTAPISPIQTFFFATHKVGIHHFNQVVLLEPARALNSEALEQAFQALVKTHSSLRLRFKQEEGTIIQEIQPVSKKPVLEELDLRDNHDSFGSLHEHACGVHQSLDIHNGPLIRAAHYHLNGSSRLLIVIHHLVVDWVSWRYLLEDLALAYEQAEVSIPPVIAPRGSAYTDWSIACQNHTAAGALDEQIDYWKRVLYAPVGVLPVVADIAEEASLKEMVPIQLIFDKQATHTLSRHIPRESGYSLHELLLTSLGRALNSIHKAGTSRIILEFHGRVNPVPDVKINAAIGWFTALYPHMLETSGNAHWQEDARRISRSLKKVPDNGFGYFPLLRQKRALEEQPIQISFNYLGEIDGDVPQRLFKVAHDKAGDPYHPETTTPYPIEISIVIIDKQLRLTINYSAKHFDSSTVQSLAVQMRKELQQMIQTGLEISKAH